MSFVTVRDLIDSLSEMIVNGEISEDCSIVDALILDNELEEWFKKKGFSTPKGHYNINKDVPDGALCLRIRSKKDSEYDTVMSFYTTKEEASTK